MKSFIEHQQDKIVGFCPALAVSSSPARFPISIMLAPMVGYLCYTKSEVAPATGSNCAYRGGPLFIIQIKGYCARSAGRLAASDTTGKPARRSLD